MNKTLILIAASLIAAPAFAKGDAAAGAEKAKQVCAACHGADGNSPTAPDFPKLAGQHYDYLVQALKQYKDGRRKNPIMAAQAQPLSKKDIEDVATFFSEQKGNLHVIRDEKSK